MCCLHGYSEPFQAEIGCDPQGIERQRTKTCRSVWSGWGSGPACIHSGCRKTWRGSSESQGYGFPSLKRSRWMSCRREVLHVMTDQILKKWMINSKASENICLPLFSALSRSIWTPGPNSTEVFGPLLKFLDPPICSQFEPWEPLVGLLYRILGRLSKLVTLNVRIKLSVTGVEVQISRWIKAPNERTEQHAR